VYTGYLILTDVEPGQGDLTAAPLPEPPSGAWDLQNLAYAAQWWLFGGFAIALWVRLVRDEARRSVEELAPAGDALTPADDAGESAATP
jgi:hypothetical protein